jgi:hypothetical protein
MAKMCQSCMMPLSKDPQHGGTNKDGSKSLSYCSMCYDNGEFRQKDMTAGQMQAFVVGKLIEGGLPKFLAKFFTRGIPKLERWRNV